MYKGDLKDFPPEIVEKMLCYQQEQGNKKDISVFERQKDITKNYKGFNWDCTDEGHCFWDKVILTNNFDLFFEKYPKSNVVCGVKLEQGKDYHITFGCYDWIIRFDKIKEDKLYFFYDVDINEKQFVVNIEEYFSLSSIDLIRLATAQESQHLSECIESNKYVEMEQVKYEVVHCETQEQWDFVLSKYAKSSSAKIDSAYYKNVCFRLDDSGLNAGLNYYNNCNCLILSFSEWCAKFNHQFEEFGIGQYIILYDELCVITKMDKVNYLAEPLNKTLSWDRALVEFKEIQKATVEQIAEHIKSGRTTFKSEEEFKVGDWVVVLPEDEYYSNCEQGKAQQILTVDSDEELPYQLKFSNGSRNTYKLIRKALPHEIPQSLPKISEMQPISGTIDVLDLKCYSSLQELANSKKLKGLIVRTIEPKQVKQEIKLLPIKLNNNSRLKLK